MDEKAGASRAKGEEASAPLMKPDTKNEKEQQAMIQAPIGERDKAVKILAKSIFRELKMNGYETRQIVALSSELLGLVTSNIKPGSDGTGG
ncbi:MAG TPA: hypothetical protein PLA87_18070 [Pseudomonadota bacterium]|jgi:hypothetical protein|nr:hypothetical protein [Pseudomonadota bacterium]